MIEKFIKWLNEQIGSVYVWGAQGEFAINEDWIKKMETSEKNAQRAIALFRQRESEGKSVAAYDCSGLVVRFFLDNDIIQSDMTAQGLYSYCDKVTRDILSPGDLVFRHNGASIHHVGVYVGDGMVIHAKGRDVGVVKEHIDVNGESYWNRFGRMKELAVKAENYPCYMKYCGDTFVNLRSEPSAASSATVKDRITHGEKVVILGINVSGWAELIKLGDRKCTRGYAIAKYFKAV